MWATAFNWQCWRGEAERSAEEAHARGHSGADSKPKSAPRTRKLCRLNPYKSARQARSPKVLRGGCFGGRQGGELPCIFEVLKPSRHLLLQRPRPSHSPGLREESAVQEVRHLASLSVLPSLLLSANPGKSSKPLAQDPKTVWAKLEASSHAQPTVSFPVHPTCNSYAATQWT